MMPLLSSYNLSISHDISNNASTKAEQWLLRCGMIKKLSSALYAYTTIGVRTLEKLIALFATALENVDYKHIMLPFISSTDLWNESEIQEAFVFDKIVFSPTSEPTIYKFFSNQKVYMNSWNVRKEKRGAFGLCRNMNFVMQDAYFSSLNAEQNEILYQEALKVYKNTFASLGIKCIQNFCTSEREKSCEFLAESSMTTDVLDVCLCCYTTLCNCKESKVKKTLLELGHVFYFFPHAWKTQNNLYAGSLGWGAGRLMQYLCEIYCDDKGMRFPANLEPFSTVVLATSLDKKDDAYSVYNDLIQKSSADEAKNIFLDDRTISFGKKMTDLEMLGCTQIIIVGNKYQTHKVVDVINRWNDTIMQRRIV